MAVFNRAGVRAVFLTCAGGHGGVVGMQRDDSVTLQDVSLGLWQVLA